VIYIGKFATARRRIGGNQAEKEEERKRKNRREVRGAIFNRLRRKRKG
jgi:hypothetical protein